MAYDKLNITESTDMTAGVFDHMDQGIKDAHDDFTSHKPQAQGFSLDLLEAYGNTKEIASCEPGEAWYSGSPNTTVSADTVNKVVGTQGIKVIQNSATATLLTARLNNMSVDLLHLNNGEESLPEDLICLSIFISDLNKFSAGFGIALSSDPLYIGVNYATATIARSGLITGPNYVYLPKSSFVLNGDFSWQDIRSMNVYSSSTLADALNTFFTFDAIRLVKKDPVDNYPNPFQRNGASYLGLAITEPYFVGKEFGKIVFRNLAPNGRIVNIIGRVLYTDKFIFTEECLQVSTNANYSDLMGWWKDNNNYLVIRQSTTGYPYLMWLENGVARDIIPEVKWSTFQGDKITKILKKDGNSVTMIAYKNGEINSSSVVTVTTGLASGYLVVGNTTGRLVNIKSLSATSSEQAYHAENSQFSEESGHSVSSDVADTLIDEALYTRLPGNAVTTGSANSYVVTLSPAPTSYGTFMKLVVAIHATNTGASVINANGLGNVPIKRPDGTDLDPGDLMYLGVYTLIYNGANFILQGKGGGETLLAGANPYIALTTQKETGSTTPVKLKEVQFNVGGSIRFDYYFGITGTNGAGKRVQGRVYINDIAVGPLRDINGVLGAWFVEDIAFNANDRIQFWAWVVNGTDGARISGLNLKTKRPLIRTLSMIN